MRHRFIEWHEANFMRNELILSLAIAGSFAAFAFWVGLYNFGNAIADRKLAVYQSAFSLSGTLLGFIISACSVMLAFGEHPKFQLLRDSGQYGPMFRVYFSAMLWLSFLIGASLAGILFDSATDNRPWIFLGLIAFACVSALRVYRCVWILKQLASIASCNYLPRRNAA